MDMFIAGFVSMNAIELDAVQVCQPYFITGPTRHSKPRLPRPYGMSLLHRHYEYPSIPYAPSACALHYGLHRRLHAGTVHHQHQDRLRHVVALTSHHHPLLLSPAIDIKAGHSDKSSCLQGLHCAVNHFGPNNRPDHLHGQSISHPVFQLMHSISFYSGSRRAGLYRFI